MESALLVVSPMNRTLETAALCFPSLVHKIPWVALEALREQVGYNTCRPVPIRRTTALVSNPNPLLPTDISPCYLHCYPLPPLTHRVARTRATVAAASKNSDPGTDMWTSRSRAVRSRCRAGLGQVPAAVRRPRIHTHIHLLHLHSRAHTHTHTHTPRIPHTGFQLGGCLSDTDANSDPIYGVYGTDREPNADVSARARLFLVSDAWFSCSVTRHSPSPPPQTQTHTHKHTTTH